ncbi:phage tail protein [Tumebacillus flagellatus]|uniref:Tail collar protein n=1 Tax=Tumebacillus flagellatus TaxID=1157490 RepID=A0A074MG96_9BACL|nr:tail fiber protein [Tumebacillus flagellatus]KEO84732.1 tail collar protein [Tumebacillus flagellatus]
MSEPYIGEIRMFAGNFAPRDWAFCNGQLMSISQNTALFSILGTRYGGDGKTTFALPNLQGAAPMGQGAGPGLTPRTVGGKVGESTVTLITSQIPPHTHVPQAIGAPGNQTSPVGNYWAEAPKKPRGGQDPLFAPTPNNQMSPVAVNVAGSSQPHNNQQPYLGVNFIIALNGDFPPQQ